MDSLTQIVLGAAVGEAVLGKKVGNKAILYGAVAGTIPDFDTFASYFTDTVSALEIHRGFTHSIIFSALFAPVFGWLVSRYEKAADFGGWAWLFFFGFITHPLLDAHTTWGTQLFWPLDIRLAYKNIFVIDPLYTLPFLCFLILAMYYKRTSAKRKKYNRLGLIVSSSYLVITLILKGITYQKFTQALEEQGVDYTQIETKPTPLNSILWTANVDTPKHYLIGHYSLFDKKPIQFSKYPKNHELAEKFLAYSKMQRMLAISNGWYTMTERNGKLYFNDLRFGLVTLRPDEERFVFSYELEEGKNTIYFKEIAKSRDDAKEVLFPLWERIWGN